MDEYDHEEVADFLEELRDSGETNMFAAAPYLQKEFGFSERQAEVVLKEWMGN